MISDSVASGARVVMPYEVTVTVAVAVSAASAAASVLTVLRSGVWFLGHLEKIDGWLVWLEFQYSSGGIGIIM